MKKNTDDNFRLIEVDTVTGEYYVNLPEWLINGEGWYEGTGVRFVVDNGDIIIMTDDQ